MQFDYTTAYLIAGLLQISIPLLIWWVLFERQARETGWWSMGSIFVGLSAIWVPLATSVVPRPLYGTVFAFLFFGGIQFKIRTFFSILAKPFPVWFCALSFCTYVLIAGWLDSLETRLYSHVFTLTTHLGLYAFMAWKSWIIYKRLGHRSSLGIFISYLAVVVMLMAVPFGTVLGGETTWSSGVPFAVLIMVGILIVFVNNIAFMGLVLENRLGKHTAFMDGTEPRQAHGNSRSVIGKLFWVSERERVLAGMARRLIHEINQPLTSLSSTVSVMGRALHDERWAELDPVALVDRMGKNLEQASDVINQIRPLAKGKSIDFQVLDLAVLVKETSDLLHFPEMRMVLRWHTDSLSSLKVRGNRTELMQVLMNVMRNAVQAAQTIGVEPDILLTLQQVHAQSCFVVTDNGPGFSPDVLTKLGRQIFSTKAEGMGLGLWISQDIVESHGGLLTYRNRHDSLGGEVILSLPVAEKG